MAGPDDVVRFARTRGIPVNLLSDLGSVRTVVEASNKLHVALSDIGNTVLATVRGQPVLVIVPGDRRVDGARVGEAFGASPREVSLATREEVRRLTGYEQGVVPPFGHDSPVPVLLDERLVVKQRVFLPAGAVNALLEISGQLLARMQGTRIGQWSAAIEVVSSEPGEPEDEAGQEA